MGLAFEVLSFLWTSRGRVVAWGLYVLNLDLQGEGRHLNIGLGRGCFNDLKVFIVVEGFICQLGGERGVQL